MENFAHWNNIFHRHRVCHQCGMSDSMQTPCKKIYCHSWLKGKVLIENGWFIHRLRGLPSFYPKWWGLQEAIRIIPSWQDTRSYSSENQEERDPAMLGTMKQYSILHHLFTVWTHPANRNERFLHFHSPPTWSWYPCFAMGNHGP